MSKNYFTDGQILKLIFDKFRADGVDMKEIDNIPSEQEIKDLKAFANLAVEAAIGKSVAKVIRPLGEQMYVDITNYSPINDGDFLYSVKELEN